MFFRVCLLLTGCLTNVFIPSASLWCARVFSLFNKSERDCKLGLATKLSYPFFPGFFFSCVEISWADSHLFSWVDVCSWNFSALLSHVWMSVYFGEQSVFPGWFYQQFRTFQETLRHCRSSSDTQPRAVWPWVALLSCWCRMAGIRLLSSICWCSWGCLALCHPGSNGSVWAAKINPRRNCYFSQFGSGELETCRVAVWLAGCRHLRLQPLIALPPGEFQLSTSQIYFPCNYGLLVMVLTCKHWSLHHYVSGPLMSHLEDFWCGCKGTQTTWPALRSTTTCTSWWRKFLTKWPQNLDEVKLHRRQICLGWLLGDV